MDEEDESGEKATAAGAASLDGLDGGGVSVKLEAGVAAASPPAVRPRGLIAVLPHHLSAVNVVRWEPVLGARLASGSDLPTQSIIIWKREDAADASATRKGGGASSAKNSSSSVPFGLGRSISSSQDAADSGGLVALANHGGSSSSSSSSSADEATFPNLEPWVAHLSLHGQGDITDLAWGPIGLHFLSQQQSGSGGGGGGGMDDDLLGFGAASAPIGCAMDSPKDIARRIEQGQGSQVLASCSLDRSVMVWNTDNGDRHHLKGHTGWVLGVAFDPLGSFLATQSIDGFLWVWSLATFQLLRKIRDVGLSIARGVGAAASARPRTDVGRTVSMARISWTPDGAALVACRGEIKRGGGGAGGGGAGGAAAAKKTASPALPPVPSRGGLIKHVSVVLNRKRNFETQAVFGGHSGRTTVSVFNPVLFCTRESTPAHPQYFSVLALGGHDCVLSLWSTRRPTPLLILTELWTDSILDLSWSSDGRTLLVASHDGSIVILKFDLQVFEGRPATLQEQQQRLRSLYGDAAVDGGGPAGAIEDGTALIPQPSALLASTHGLLDSPALLELQAQQKAAQQRLRQVAEAEQQKIQAERAEAELRKQAETPATSSALAAAASSSSGFAAAAPTGVSTLALQTEVRRADGKRRIVPVSVAAPVDAAASVAPIRSTSTSATAGVGASATAGIGAGSAAAHLAHATPAMLMQLTAGGASLPDTITAPPPPLPLPTSTATTTTATTTAADSTDLFGVTLQQPKSVIRRARCHAHRSQ